jgi:hypothetical protein
MCKFKNDFIFLLKKKRVSTHLHKKLTFFKKLYNIN